MTLSNISASCQVTSRLTGSGVTQGGIDTLISQAVRGESLDSFYSNVIDGEDLAAMDQVFDAFPAVELNGDIAQGQDNLPLLLNSIHGIIIQVIQDEGLTSAGYAAVTVEDIGNDSPSVFNLVAGDCLHLTTTRGWPALATSQIAIGATGLTNCQVVICLLGKTDAEATGYGS